MTKIFSIYDSKTEAFMQPFFMATKGAAIRDWTQAIADEKTPFCRHPQDFTLFEIGEWDDQKGQITTHATPVSLGVAIEFKKQSHEATPLFKNSQAN